MPLLLKTAGGVLLTPPLEGDGFAVRATPAQAPHRSAVLRRAGWVRFELEKSVGLPRLPDALTTEIEIGTGPPSGVIDHALLRSGRRVWGVVRVPDAAAAEPEELDFALTAVLFRAAIHCRASSPEVVREPPAWFVRGISRFVIRERHGEDFESAYALWSRGRLPGVIALWSTNSFAERHPATASQLVAWCVARPGRRARWEALCRHLAAGGEWDAAAIARIWNDSDDLAALDEQWDLWLLARARRIFDVGVTPPGLFRRFRAHLFLHPWEYDTLAGVKPLESVPLPEYLARLPQPGCRQTLMRKASLLRLQGAGRDVAFRGMTELYAAALEAAADGGAERPWLPIWQQAEAERRALEARAAAGETLRTPPELTPRAAGPGSARTRE